MRLEVYFFTFLYVLMVSIYFLLSYKEWVNENERHFLLIITLIPLVCLILVL